MHLLIGEHVGQWIDEHIPKAWDLYRGRFVFRVLRIGWILLACKCHPCTHRHFRGCQMYFWNSKSDMLLAA